MMMMAAIKRKSPVSWPTYDLFSRFLRLHFWYNFRLINFDSEKNPKSNIFLHWIPSLFIKFLKFNKRFRHLPLYPNYIIRIVWEKNPCERRKSVETVISEVFVTIQSAKISTWFCKFLVIIFAPATTLEQQKKLL